MPLKSDKLVKRLRLRKSRHALGVVPCPDLVELESNKRGVAALDLRLGRWLLALRQSRATLLEVKEADDDRPAMPALAENFLKLLSGVNVMAEGFDDDARRWALEELGSGIEVSCLQSELDIEQLKRDADEPARLAKYHFVPFGDRFILHPGDSVLGITFEWLKLPSDLAGFVTGKSKWGRRALIIETAAGIHPGFCGCLTLEIGNVGPIPIPLIQGIEICQIFFENAEGNAAAAESQFDGNRRPVLGDIRIDKVVEALRRRS